MVDKSEKHLRGCEAVLLRQVRRLAGSWQLLILGSTPGIVAGSQETKFRLKYVIHSSLYQKGVLINTSCLWE
jgi:hypothetical protein